MEAANTSPVKVPEDLRKAAEERGWPGGLLQRALSLGLSREDIEWWLGYEDHPLDRLELVLSAREGLTLGSVTGRDYSELAFKTATSESLAAADRRSLLALFDKCYRQANHAYLQDSLDHRRYVSMAHREGRLVGFALGDGRAIDLPRLPQQAVFLGGLACVAPEFRRRKLMGELAQRNINASTFRWADRGLICARFAHPAVWREREVGGSPSRVPKRGVQPTPWQQEVGRAIAEAYGVTSFDPTTFVCKGDGTTIGHPIVEIEVEQHDWDVFRHVDRERGDSLLGLYWSPDAPAGW